MVFPKIPIVVVKKENITRDEVLMAVTISVLRLFSHVAYL
jgi:hypothetical protein